MQRSRRLAALVGALALALGPLHAAAQEGPLESDPEITVRIGNSAWVYTHQELLAMATTKIPNQKRTKQKPAIPLEALLFKDTGLTLEQVDTIFVVPVSGMITILRGKDLAHVDQLVLATGEKKGGHGHPWAMAAESEATYQALKEVMGSNRKHAVNRIDIVPKAAQ